MEIVKKLNITSDNSDLEFVRTEKGKEELFVYKYVKSNFNLGKEVKFTKRELVKQMNNFFVEIE